MHAYGAFCVFVSVFHREVAGPSFQTSQSSHGMEKCLRVSNHIRLYVLVKLLR